MSHPPSPPSARGRTPSCAARPCPWKCVPCPLPPRATTAADRLKLRQPGYSLGWHRHFCLFPPFFSGAPMTVKFSKDHEWIDISDHEAAAVVEPVKAAADVYMPVSGEIVEVNEALRAAPSLANTDPLGAGWFFKVHVTDMMQFDALMDEPAYAEFAKNA